MDKDTLATAFVARRALLQSCSSELQDGIQECLEGVPHIDRVTTRVKDVARFVAKATDGGNRYSEPLEEIEDQVAGRVIVFFERDIDMVADRLRGRFSPVEDFRHEPPRDAEFGYLTHHLVFVIPSHLKPPGWEDLDPMPTTFEVQLRTLFMHAYAEPQHDLSYKNASELTSPQRRQLAWIAASAWGADRAYEQVLDSMMDEPEGHS